MGMRLTTMPAVPVQARSMPTPARRGKTRSSAGRRAAATSPSSRPRVVGAATEQQPPVRGRAVVVEHHTAVVDREPVGVDRGERGRVEPLGDEVAEDGRQQQSRQGTAFEPVVGVARQHDRLCPHRSGRREGAGRVTRFDARHLRALEHARAERGGGSRLAVAERQRVEVQVPVIQHPAVIERRLEPLVHFGARQPAGLGLVEAGQPGVGQGGLQSRDVAARPRRVQVPRTQLAVDAVTRHALADDRVPAPAQPAHERARLAFSDVPAKLALHRDIARQAAGHLPAVASRRPPPDASSLQQRHRYATLGQPERGRDPGQPAADDRDVDADVLLERGVARHLAERGGVVAVDVLRHVRGRPASPPRSPAG